MTLSITTTAAELNEALRTAGAWADLPMFDGQVCITATDAITVRAAGTDGFLSIAVAGQIHAPGRVRVSAKTLSDICRLMTDEIQLSEADSKLSVTAPNANYKLVCAPPEDMPEPPADTPDEWLPLDAAALADACKAVEYALPAKDHRRVLLGVNVSGGQVTATDGKKLCMIPGAPGLDVTLPPSVFPILRGMGQCESAMANGRMLLRSAWGTAVINPIPGKYPDCNAVIPREFTHAVRTSRAALVGVVKRSAITADEKNRTVALHCRPDAIDVSSAAHDVGQYSGQIAAELDGPEACTIMLNAEMLLQTLAAMPAGDALLIKAKAAGGAVAAPVVLAIDGVVAGTWLLMPIKPATGEVANGPAKF